ncbi:S8 family serine peptidase [Neomegalonema sp.]|uniref:S8 family peptidase n=1 Tax=Neomegalonema sp. TaxID=2039713 RepID=UPI002615C899|nr:S8 family serine peptidase [Neomegalonema sp.]MDD2869461.1 S8 family serine peptidase [Neomegalonema sp.]
MSIDRFAAGALIGALCLGLAGPGARKAAAEDVVSLSPYVEPLLHETIRLRGAVRAVIRLREDEGGARRTGGRFSTAAAAAQGALEGAAEGPRPTGIQPLGGDLRVAEITAAQLQALIDSGAASEIYVDRLTSAAFDRLRPWAAEPPAPSPSPPAQIPGAQPPQPQAGGAGEPSPSGAPPSAPSASVGTAPPPSPPPPPAPPEGPAAAVIDTGVDAAHPYLEGLVVRQACFSSTVAADRARTLCPNGRAAQTLGDAARPCDPLEMGPLCAHGTKVAGLISGRGGGYLGPEGESHALEGIAPGAPILAIQVFSRVEDPLTCAAFGQTAPCPLSYVSDQIAALRFVSSVAAEHDVAVANLSLASAAPSDPCDEAFQGRQYLAEIVYLLERMGVATVAATGNSGSVGTVGMPACVSRSLAVAALDAQGSALARFSNISDSADLAAPGVDLMTSTLGATLYATDQGTSFAAPQVAGALLKLRRQAPGLSIERLTALLEEAGPRLEGARDGGLPILDLPAALALLDQPAAFARAASAPSLATASSGGTAPLPPRIGAPGAPTALSPEVLARLRPATGAEGDSLLFGSAAYARAIRPAPPPVYFPAPPPPAPVTAASPPEFAPETGPDFAAIRAGTGARFMIEVDPEMADLALGGAPAGPEARLQALRLLALQAAPAESPVADLQIDPRTGRGVIAFETRLDSRQAESFAAGFPGLVAPDRLSAP